MDRDKAKAAQVMFDFIAELQHAKNVDDIMAEMSKAAEFFGLNAFVVSGLPLPGEKIDPYFLLSGWSEEWFRRYLEKNHVQVDPVIYQTRISDEPFVWSDILADRQVQKASMRVMNEATEYRMRDGFSVPLHMPGGLQAIVSYGAEKVELSAEDKSILHIISIYAHNHLRTLITTANKRAPKEVPYITPHERDVIKWAAEGKTNWEIGQILGRSDKTVQHELHSAQKKLNCVNRGQLIAESLRLGIIR